MSGRAPLLSGADDNHAQLDVLVVGAGPVGLLSAIELASRGCQVRIIDENVEPILKTKASGIAVRSMQVLPVAVCEKILNFSRIVDKGRLLETQADGSLVLLTNLDMSGAPMRSQMQWKTEQFLKESLETLPDRTGAAGSLRVERGLKLVNFSESESGVECELERGDGAKERVAAKFLLGCDGGGSQIRRKLGFSFDGEATAEYFFALHAAFEGYIGDPTELAVFCSKESSDVGAGFGFTMPMPDGGYLVTLDLDDAQQARWKTGEKDRHGFPILKQPTPEDIVSVLSARGFGRDLKVVPDSVKWVAAFRVQSRQAEHYGKGRVYLAGDACHCHSPLGGQGMNMGFQDAKNIAWKLGFAAKGALPISRLSTYEGERYGIEKKICKNIETGQKVMSVRSPIAQFIRSRGQRIGPMLLQFTGKMDSVMKYSSQQAWSYAGSPMCTEHWERPPVSLASICPAGGFRRRQNMFRWIGTRVHAGDAVPDAELADGGSIQSMLKKGKGWALLLFEGAPEHNEENDRLIGKTVLPVEALQSLGESLKWTQPGFVCGIDTVMVLSWAKCHAAHEVFGVRGQCLFLVRPDFHVGLRSEPVRAGAVYRYFKESCAMANPPVKEESAPAGAPLFDVLPVAVWGSVFVALAVWWVVLLAQSKPQSVPLDVCLVFAFVVLVALFRFSKPPH